MSNPSHVGREAAARRRRGRAGGPAVGAFFDFDGTLIDGYSLGVRPPPPAVGPGHPARRGAHAAARPARRHHRGGLRGVLRARHARVGGAQRGRARRAGRAAVGAGDRRLALPGGLAAGRGAPPRRAHRRVRVVGHPLPGGARRARDGRRARARHPGRDRERHRDRTPRRPAAVAARARPRPCARSPRSTASTSRRATPTPTAPRTCRSCRRSGARGRSTPSRGWRSARREGLAGRAVPPRGAGAGLRQVVRTAAGAAGMIGGFGAGVALGAVNGSRRDGVDLGIALAGELGTALAGVRLDVRGAEHLESARPAVFLFNHQSQLDVLILAKLLRGGFTGVAKKEAANVPAFGLMFRLADMAFVDRGNTAQAKAARARGARLREGISLVMAPEGTRSATPALGPFKKGAFHVAMQAGVPIVPIVIRNAGELMWRGASTIREGTVQVTVLPPVPTDGWTVEDLDKHVEEVRERYLETLAEWDGPPAEVQVTSGPTGPRRRAAGMGHRRRDEPARNGDVARRSWPTRGCARTSRCWSCSTSPRTGTGCSPRTSGRRGWCRGCVSGWSSPRSGSGRPRGSPSTGRHHRARVPRPPDRRLAARAARPRAGVRPQAVRPRPAAVAGAARRGPAGRGSGVRGGHPPLRHRRPRRDPAHGAAAQPDPRARPAAARARGVGGGGRRPRSGCWRARWRARSARCPATRCGRAAADPARGGPRGGARGRAAARPGGRPRVGLAAAGPRSGEWHFDVLDVPLAALKAGREGGGRLGERRVPRRRARRVPPLPRGARRAGARDDPDRHPDQPAHRGRPAGRQPVHRRPARRPARRARPRGADPGRAPVRAAGAGARVRRPGRRCWGRCSPGCPGPCSARCRAG